METVWAVYSSFEYEGLGQYRLFSTAEKAIQEVLKSHIWKHNTEPYDSIRVRFEDSRVYFVDMQNSSWNYQTNMRIRKEDDWFERVTIIVEEIKIN